MTTDISVVRGGWDPTLQQEIVDEYEYDGGNSSSRLFERSRIKALAGRGSYGDPSPITRVAIQLMDLLHLLSLPFPWRDTESPRSALVVDSTSAVVMSHFVISFCSTI